MEKPDGSGPVTPIHVKVKTHEDDAGLACAEDGCKEISTPAGRGQQNFFCHHISQALHCPSNVDESEYPDIQSVTMSTAMKAGVIRKLITVLIFQTLRFETVPTQNVRIFVKIL